MTTRHDRARSAIARNIMQDRQDAAVAAALDAADRSRQALDNVAACSVTAQDLSLNPALVEPPIHSVAVDDAMHAWLRECANPTRISDILDAYLAGLLTPGDGVHYRFVATARGRDWLVTNAIRNGASRFEALSALDYLDGA